MSNFAFGQARIIIAPPPSYTPPEKIIMLYILYCSYWETILENMYLYVRIVYRSNLIGTHSVDTHGGLSFLEILSVVGRLADFQN